MHVIETNFRQVEITVNGRSVSNLFDENGEETFDATAAVESADGNVLQSISDGDTIVVTVYV